MVALAGCSNSGDTDGSSSDNTPDGNSGESAGTVASPPASQQAKLAADDGNSNDGFGGSVALSADGETALIGAPGEEEPNGQGAGAAYIFARSEDSWTQQAKLTAEGGSEDDLFGISVALSDNGETALLGADLEDTAARGAGAAYVFTSDNEAWEQDAKLVANDGDENDNFGDAVALAGDGATALIGAYNDEDPNGENRFGDGAGSAYIFGRSGSTWEQQAKIAANDGEGGDRFGEAVAMADDGTAAFIGCSRPEATYVFRQNNDSWTQQSKLIPNETDERVGTIATVAANTDGTTALVGSFVDSETDGMRVGSAYVFTRSDGTWTQQEKLSADDGDEEDLFAASIALSSDGRTALAGARRDEDPNGTRAGSAYVFTSSDGTWTQQEKLTADDGDKNDSFGISVALSGDGGTGLIGAAGDEDPNGQGELDGGGSAYIFE
jgi:hypothetical protein